MKSALLGALVVGIVALHPAIAGEVKIGPQQCGFPDDDARHLVISIRGVVADGLTNLVKKNGPEDDPALEGMFYSRDKSLMCDTEVGVCFIGVNRDTVRLERPAFCP